MGIPAPKTTPPTADRWQKQRHLSKGYLRRMQKAAQDPQLQTAAPSLPWERVTPEEAREPRPYLCGSPLWHYYPQLPYRGRKLPCRLRRNREKVQWRAEAPAEASTLLVGDSKKVVS